MELRFRANASAPWFIIRFDAIQNNLLVDRNIYLKVIALTWEYEIDYLLI